MVTLPSDFIKSRYGIECRLVQIEDSEFIISLRTDEKLSKYLHQTENNIEKQREWIRQYETRNAKGEDFYFIYSYKGQPFGVNRISNIKMNEGTGGSWICKPGTLPEVSIASLLLMRDILFEDLALEADVFDVQFGNKQVRKLHLMMGAKKVRETGNQENFKLYKSDYIQNRETIKSILNIL